MCGGSLFFPFLQFPLVHISAEISFHSIRRRFYVCESTLSEFCGKTSSVGSCEEQNTETNNKKKIAKSSDKREEEGKSKRK